MHRISHITASLKAAQAADPTSIVQADESDEGLTAIMKNRRTQALEDQSKVLEAWKAKGSVKGAFVAPFLLGEFYKYYSSFLTFNATDLHPKFGDFILMSKEEQRLSTNIIMATILKKFPMTPEKFKDEPWLLTALVSIWGGMYGPVGTKIAVHFSLYCKTISTLGTEKHQSFVERGLRLEDVGCFGLTEISHGSNVQGMLTTAIFDERESCFVLNTPTDRAAKFWIGGASQTANMSVVGANLIVKGKNYGIHMFIVEIRDRQSHELKDGVTIGDCGDKQGLNGIDNGYMIFRNVSIPLDNLLDRITSVSETGEVTSAFHKKTQRFAIQLSGLCDGRVKIPLNTFTIGIRASAILLRFSVVRRQFGPKKNQEVSLLEYQQYQNRVLPHVASLLIGIFSTRETNKLWFNNFEKVLDPKNKEVKEMLAIISIMKPLHTWALSEMMNEYRQALGGFGYLTVSQIGPLLNDLHVMMTWEGDNYVLLHQTAKFIMKGVAKIAKGKPVSYPSLKFLTTQEPEEYFAGITFDKASLADPEVQLKLLSYRASKASFKGAMEFQEHFGENDPFTAWNKSVPFGLSDAAIFYGDLHIFKTAYDHIKHCSDEGTKAFLLQLLTIYALNLLKKTWHSVNEFLNASNLDHIHKVLLKTYDHCKYDVVRVMDDLTLNNQFVNSVFGDKEGNIYGRLMSKVQKAQKDFPKPKGWKEVWANRQSY